MRVVCRRRCAATRCPRRGCGRVCRGRSGRARARSWLRRRQPELVAVEAALELARQVHVLAPPDAQAACDGLAVAVAAVQKGARAPGRDAGAFIEGPVAGGDAEMADLRKELGAARKTAASVKPNCAATAKLGRSGTQSDRGAVASPRGGRPRVASCRRWWRSRRGRSRARCRAGVGGREQYLAACEARVVEARVEVSGRRRRALAEVELERAPA